MTAQEVKDALRRRHPAIEQFGGPGAWTCIEEWDNIDLLAFSAWSSAKPPIVGYEVKVSRSDYRRELLNPSKRTLAVESCWQFYFAVPKGLLTKEEKAYREPEHFEDGSAFVREGCPERCRLYKGWFDDRFSEAEAAVRRKTGREVEIPVAFGDEACLCNPWSSDERGAVINPATVHRHRVVGSRRNWEVCKTCGGRGYMQKSVVEQGAPTLWIPNDVGLIEVGDDGKCRTVRKAPKAVPTREFGPLGKLLRWASFRPDPRHEAERERQRTGGASLEVAA